MAAPAKLDVCAALTAVIPGLLTIQELRARHDPAFHRWPPHFNFGCFPFLAEPARTAALPRVQAALRGVRPFYVRLGSVHCFEGGKGKQGTMYATVEGVGVGDDDGNGDADAKADGPTQVYVALKAALPELYAQSEGRPFVPHVTLGRFDSAATLHATTAAVAATWKPMIVHVQCLQLLVRSSDGPFFATHEFPLGGTSFVGVRAAGAGAAAGAGSASAGAGSASAAAAAAAGAGSTTPVVQGFLLGNRWVCRVQLPRQAARRRLMNVVVVDNSASMGPLAGAALSTIGQGMFLLPPETVELMPGALIVFSATATVLRSRVKSLGDLEGIKLPSQLNTNITAGITAAVEAIVAAAPPRDTHVVLTFLSDGAHNAGPAPDGPLLARLHGLLSGLSVTVIVVGVGVSSDTTLGMQIKTALETVTVPGLRSIYFVPTPTAMPQALAQIQEGLLAHVTTGGVVPLTCPTHTFFDTGTHESTVYVSAEGTATLIVCADSGAAGDGPPPLFRVAVPGDADADTASRHVLLPCTVTSLDVDMVTDAVEGQVERLARLAVAQGTGAVRLPVAAMKALVDECAAVVAREARESREAQGGADVPGKTRPAQRLAALRAFRRSEVSFRELVNRLEEVRCGVANDSATQAAFLTGMQRKFGQKAVRRAGTLDTDLNDVLAQVATAHAAATAAATAAAATASAEGVDEEEEASMLSLNTAGEQLEEWGEVLAGPQAPDDVYGVLVAFGMCGYPIRMAQTAAAQMDPWQTWCLDVEPYMVDSASVMLANQTGHTIRGPNGKDVTDVLVLVQPGKHEAATLVGCKSIVNRYLCSVTLCRDLYMYQPGMELALHGHAFVTCCGKLSGGAGASTGAGSGTTRAASQAYLRLALTILHSARAMCGGPVYSKLLTHWLREWGTLTTSLRDGCKHPAQAVFALALADWSEDLQALVTGSAVQPLLTLLCEVVARRCRGIIRNASDAGSGSGSGPAAAAAEVSRSIVGRMYGITASNSPQATEDPMAAEPDADTVRRSCPPTHTLTPSEFPSKQFDGAATPQGWVRAVAAPYYAAFRLGVALQATRTWREGHVPDLAAVSAALNSLPADFVEYVHGGDVSASAEDAMLQTMFVQGLLHNDSSSRSAGSGTATGAAEGDADDADDADESNAMGSVLDRGTLHDLLVEVHMAHYADSCADKRQRWLDTVGDVTLQQATEASVDVFEHMIGTHTHGLTKAVFWSLVKAAKRDPAKQAVFLHRSNPTVPHCFVPKAARRKAAKAAKGKK